MNNYQIYSDAELLPLIRENKPVCDFAFDTLYKRYSGKLHSYCLFHSKNRVDADTVFHDTWVKFYLNIKSGNKVDNALSFLVTIARNIIIDNARSSSRKMNYITEMTDLTDLKSALPDNQLNENQSELIELIHLAVDSLDEIYKEPFVLKRYYDFSNEEIAKICGETVECIRKRITRATHKVRELIQSYINNEIE